MTTHESYVRQSIRLLEPTGKATVDLKSNVPVLSFKLQPICDVRIRTSTERFMSDELFASGNGVARADV